MKKRIVLLFLVVGMMAAGCRNKEVGEMPEIQISEKTDTEDREKAEDLDVQETAEESIKDPLSFSEFQDIEFYFASGAGGWRTVMQIEADGSFSGEYSDSDMGLLVKAIQMVHIIFARLRDNLRSL